MSRLLLHQDQFISSWWHLHLLRHFIHYLHFIPSIKSIAFFSAEEKKKNKRMQKSFSIKAAGEHGWEQHWRVKVAPERKYEIQLYL